jgi:hypothetical protein
MKNIVSTIFLLALSLMFAETVSAQNIIEAENQKTGASDWILTKVHSDTCRLLKPYKADLFCRQQDIEGYCSHTSIKAGETLSVLVSANPASLFTVDIYRMGYYSGKGARKNDEPRAAAGASATYAGRR